MDQSGLVQHQERIRPRPFLIRSASHQFKGGSQELEASAEAGTNPAGVEPSYRQSVPSPHIPLLPKDLTLANLVRQKVRWI